MTTTRDRVVVTGIGLICPLGNSTEALWDALRERRSGVGPLTTLPEGAVPVRCAAEAKQFTGHIKEFGDLPAEKKKTIRKGLKVMCREIQMGVAAAELAIADARLGDAGFEPGRIGVAFGSDYMITEPDEFTEPVKACLSEDGSFDYSRWPTDGMARMSPLWLLKYLPNMPAAHIAIYNDFRGPSNSLTLREATPNMVLEAARNTILADRADALVVGCTGTRLHVLKTIHALQQTEIATGEGMAPETVSRPFDADRTGMVLGEGAACLIVERMDKALERGAVIQAEILGAASNTAVDRNMVADPRKAMALAMAEAMRRAGLEPDEIDFVVAHGLGTRSGDAAEAQAIRDVFGDRDVPVTAPKSYFGNLGAASGVVETIAGILSLREGVVCPTLNYETPDPQCPVHVVTDGTVPAGRRFLNVNVSPQGQASAAVLARVEA
ncbi:beta-ketoacyl synthase [Thermostilla marina]